jgi:hypothetical protein
MPSSNIDIPAALKSLGIKADSFSNFRFGPGVVGKISLVVTSAIIVLGIIAIRTSSEILLGALSVGVIGLAAWHSKTIRSFAKDNPALAILEGAEYVAHQQIYLAAKGQAIPPDQPLIESPSGSPVSLIQAEPENVPDRSR